jgi:hypothetical protein
MHMQWARDGLLVVGLDNEMHIYSQWQVHCSEAGASSTAAGNADEAVDETDARAIAELNVSTLATSSAAVKSLKLSPSVSVMKLAQSASYSSLSGLPESGKKDKRKDKLSLTLAQEVHQRALAATNKQASKDDSINSVLITNDCGLFEAARLANPVLPQYHPTQLLELLNFGKVRRVKAILAHLVRCISGSVQGSGGGLSRKDTWRHMSSRRLSSSASPTEHQTIPEEVASSHLEILSIPPLPLHALLMADQDVPVIQRRGSNK